MQIETDQTAQTNQPSRILQWQLAPAGQDFRQLTAMNPVEPYLPPDPAGALIQGMGSRAAHVLLLLLGLLFEIRSGTRTLTGV